MVSHILPESMLFADLPAVVDFLSLAGAPAVSIILVVVGESADLLELYRGDFKCNRFISIETFGLLE
jgi:hypothetical protein